MLIHDLYVFTSILLLLEVGFTQDISQPFILQYLQNHYTNNYDRPIKIARSLDIFTDLTEFWSQEMEHRIG